MSEQQECRFEMVTLYCVDCGGATGILGTCEDVVWCERCNSKPARGPIADGTPDH